MTKWYSQYSRARGADDQRLNHLEHSIVDVGAVSELGSASMRSLAERTAQLIWKADLFGTNTFPEDWTNYQKHGGVVPKWLDYRMGVPYGDGQQTSVATRDVSSGKAG